MTERARFSPTTRKMLVGIAVVFLGATAFILWTLSDAINAERDADEKQFQVHRADLEASIATWAPFATNPGPANVSLEHARFALRAAVTEHARNIIRADDRLLEGITYVCEAQLLISGQTCPPMPKPGILDWVASPTGKVATGFISLVIGSYFVSLAQFGPPALKPFVSVINLVVRKG